MFQRIRLRFQDMKTLSTLTQGAETHANLSGDEKAGAEHYVLSALDLPDGSAMRIFNVLGISSEQYKQSLEKQYSDALDSVGVSMKNTKPDPIEERTRLVHVQPSGAELMKSLHSIKQSDKDRALLGAHVLSVVANMKKGVAIRAFRALGIDGDKLSSAVNSELD